MSNLSELLPAGAGAKSADFVASGTLGSGVTVALQSDGTVEAVAESLVPTAIPAGSRSGFSSYDSYFINIAYDPHVSNTFIVAWQDSNNSNYGSCKVGTVSGTTISYGATYVFASTNSRHIKLAMDEITSGRLAIFFCDNNNGAIAKMVAGTRSGTTLSFGSVTNTNTNTAVTQFYSMDIKFHKTIADRFLIAYPNANNGNAGVIGLYPVTGTSIGSNISLTTFNSGSTRDLSIAADPITANSWVVVYNDASNGQYGTARSFTCDASSISMNSGETVFLSSLVYQAEVDFDPFNANKFVVMYTDYNNSNSGACKVGTISGSSISFGSAITWLSGINATNNAIHFDPNTENRLGVQCLDGTSARLKFGIGEVSGNSISFTIDTDVFGVTGYSGADFDFDANRNSFFASTINGSTHKGNAIVSNLSYSSTNSADFIGITDQAIADTATGAVIVQGGVSEKLSGLTVGADYYVQADGSISSPTVSVPSNINNSTYDNKFLSVVGQELNSTGFRFNTDGTKVYIVGYGNDTVYQYSLSQAFEIDTASYDSVSFSVATQDTNPHGIAFNISGTKMYILGYGNDTVFQYSLSSAFDLSSASYDSVSFSVASQETQPQGIAFNSDGTKMYIVGFINDTVFQYSLSSSFDLSSASYDSVSFSVAGQDISPSGLCFNSDGSEMYVVGTTSDTIYQYSLSSSFDLSSASYNGASFNVSSEEAIPNDVYMRPDNLKFYVLGRGQDDLLQYSTGVGSVTSVPAGRALSSTSILLEG
jgi:hypothetical protein